MKNALFHKEKNLPIMRDFNAYLEISLTNCSISVSLIPPCKR